MYKSTKKSQLNIKLSTQRRNVKRGRKGNETVPNLSVRSQGRGTELKLYYRN
jgi:hypothetical protein